MLRRFLAKHGRGLARKLNAQGSRFLVPALIVRPLPLVVSAHVCSTSARDRDTRPA
jgi:hypothetical protein